MQERFKGSRPAAPPEAAKIMGIGRATLYAALQREAW